MADKLGTRTRGDYHHPHASSGTLRERLIKELMSLEARQWRDSQGKTIIGALWVCRDDVARIIMHAAEQGARESVQSSPEVCQCQVKGSSWNNSLCPIHKGTNGFGMPLGNVVEAASQPEAGEASAVDNKAREEQVAIQWLRDNQLSLGISDGLLNDRDVGIALAAYKKKEFDRHTPIIRAYAEEVNSLLRRLESGAMTPDDKASQLAPWRVGSKVHINVYEGDRPICQCHTAEDAKRIVNAVNAALLRPHLGERPARAGFCPTCEGSINSCGHSKQNVYSQKVEGEETGLYKGVCWSCQRASNSVTLLSPPSGKEER